VHHLRKVTWGE